MALHTGTMVSRCCVVQKAADLLLDELPDALLLGIGRVYIVCPVMFLCTSAAAAIESLDEMEDVRELAALLSTG